MALALLFEDDSVMYIDAVESYTKGFNSSISSHPIDNRAVITDHVAKTNPTFSIKGVISAADFQTLPLGFEGEHFDTIQRMPTSEAVISSISNALDFLPGSLQQFISTGPLNDVTMDEFRGYSHQAARDRLEQAWDQSEIITILDYDYDYSTGRSSSIRSIKDCLIKNYTDTEQVETGDALEFTIMFERVRFSFLKQVDVRTAQPSVSSQTAPLEDKGEQGSDDIAEDTQEKQDRNLYEKIFKQDGGGFLGINIDLGRATEVANSGLEDLASLPTQGN